LLASDEFDKALQVGKTVAEIPTPAKSSGAKMADILKKYFGDEPLKLAERFNVADVQQGDWRTLRLDGVKKIEDSIEKNGVLDIHLWLVEKRDNGLHAVDCNHRRQAFINRNIKTALGLIFPKLTEEEYMTIAGVANEFHDEGSVKVTDWDKYCVVVRLLQQDKFISQRGYNVPLIVDTMVSLQSLCPPRGGPNF
jgi:hypothetical protein